MFPIRYKVFSRKSIPLDPNYTLKGELLGFYAQLEGLSRNTSQPNETALVSGQLTRNAPWGSVFGSGGYLRHAMNGAVVDTDIGYPFSLSLDRNREGMQSPAIGRQLSFNSAIYTDICTDCDSRL